MATVKPTPTEIKEDLQQLDKTKKFLSFVQEFSKKIVVIAFIIYVITSIFSLYMVYVSYKEGCMISIDTLITETNTTFRDVIGGYIIKAALENVIKIGGDHFGKITTLKMSSLQKSMEDAGELTTENPILSEEAPMDEDITM